MQVRFFMFFLFCFNTALSQSKTDTTKTRRWDQGGGTLNYINEKGISAEFDGINTIESGYLIGTNRIGVWEIKNEKGKLVGHSFFEPDGITYEVQYFKGKIYSVVRSKTTTYTRSSGEQAWRIQYLEVLSFDRRGRIKSRLLKTTEGKDSLIKY